MVIICGVENFDPMGVHTGDSITVAPTMTLSDTAYQQMRNTAIRMKEENAEMIYERRKEMGLTRVFKMVDTCSAEFEAKTPYFYSTFEKDQGDRGFGGGQSPESNESKVSSKRKIIVLGSGPNRIGQGIEFDYCCVHD